MNVNTLDTFEVNTREKKWWPPFEMKKKKQWRSESLQLLLNACRHIGNKSFGGSLPSGTGIRVEISFSTDAFIMVIEMVYDGFCCCIVKLNCTYK